VAALSPAQRRVLVLCIAQGVTKDEARGTTLRALRALESKGLAHLRISRKKREVWRATDTGRGLIAQSGLAPTFLHRRSEHGYTHSLAHAMPREPEVISLH
jgi:hypothetical protein